MVGSIAAPDEDAGCAYKAVAVTPDDSNNLANPRARGLYIGVTGDVVVIPLGNEDADTMTFKAHPVGYMPVQVRRVLATGTTATNILALY